MGTCLVAQKGPLAGQTFPLPPLATLLGADPWSDITWPDEALAEQHALVRWNGQQHVLVDLGSAGGTWVNGQRLDGPRVLQLGDEIGIGSSLFRVKATMASRGSPAPATPATAETAPAPVAMIEEREAGASSSSPLWPLAILALAMAAVLLWAVPAVRDRMAAGSAPTVTAPINQAAHSPTAEPRRDPTWTPQSENTPRYYPVPVLLSPSQGAQGTMHLLQWSWQGALGVDEWYSAWVWRSGESPRSLAWTKVPQMEIGAGLAPGAYTWQVVVVQGVRQGQYQRDLSAPSETRQFVILSPTATSTLRPTATSTATSTPTQTATPTRTLEPVVQLTITGRVYDARLGPSSPLGNAEVRIYAADQRAIVRSNVAGQYRAEFRLRNQSSGQQLDLLAVLSGYEPGVAHYLLGNYPPESTQAIVVDLALARSSTPTATWLPPTATLSPTASPSPTATRTKTPTAVPPSPTP